MSGARRRAAPRGSPHEGGDARHCEQCTEGDADATYALAAPGLFNDALLGSSRHSWGHIGRGLVAEQCGHRSAEALNYRDQLIGLVALLSREADELASTSDHRASLGGAAYARAEPTAELQEPFLAQIA